MTTPAKDHGLINPPVAKAAMLIRKPVADVFEAFVDPAITSKFWFTEGSGRLEAGRQVEWRWAMYNFSMSVGVKAVVPNEKIVVEWPTEGGGPSTVEWAFSSRADGSTFVSIAHAGFHGKDGDDLVGQAVGSTEGFTLVLAGLKAFLEQGVVLNLVRDRYPDGL